MAIPKTVAVTFYIPTGSGGSDIVTVDACVSEQHAITSTLTDHPVEQGSPITDHSRPEPRMVTLECYVSNTPLAGNPTGENYANDLWARFKALQTSPQLIDVSTAREFYTSMGIVSVTSPVDVKTANVLKFSITMKNVRVVQNKLTSVVISKQSKAQPLKHAGEVLTFTVNETDPNFSEVSAAYIAANGNPTP